MEINHFLRELIRSRVDVEVRHIDTHLHGWQTIANVYPKGQNKGREEKMEEKEEMLENQVSSGTLPCVFYFD